MKTKHIVIIALVGCLCMVCGLILILQTNDKLKMNLKKFYQTYQITLDEYFEGTEFCSDDEAKQVVVNLGYTEASDSIVSCLYSLDDEVLLVEYTNANKYINQIKTQKDNAIHYKRSMFNDNVLVFKKEIDYLVYDDCCCWNNLIVVNDRSIAISDQEAGLNYIELPNYVKMLGAYCFTRNANTLQYVFITQHLERICDFAYCKSPMVTRAGIVEGMIIDEFSLVGIKEIDIAENCTTYKLVDGVLYSADETELVLFPRNKNITTYVIPQGVKKIWSYAFYNTLYLEAVAMPDTVESVGVSAFEKSSIKDIDWSENATKILYNTFKKSKIQSFEVCQNVQYINKNAFFMCDDLVAISVDSGNELFEVQDGMFYSGDSKVLYKALDTESKTYVIPECVEVVEEMAFYGIADATIYLHQNIKQLDFDNYSWYNFQRVYVESVSLLQNKDLYDADFEEIYILSSLSTAGIEELAHNYTHSSTAQENDKNYEIWVIKYE